MATGDLVTLSQVQTAYPGLTTAQLADLPSIISAVSVEVSRRYPRVSLKAAYDETHDPGSSRTITLKRRPVLGLIRVRADRQMVLRIGYTGAGRRANAEVVNSGEADAPIASSLVLNEEVNGVASTPVELDFATYPTVQSLADHIDTLSNWTATVSPLQGTMASVDLEPTQGPLSALLVGAGLWGYVRDLNECTVRDPLNGELLLYEWKPQSFVFPGSIWGTDPRVTTIRVQYYAGRLTIPADVVRAVTLIVQAELFATAQVGQYAEERSDDYARKLAAPTYRFPPDAERILSRYKDRRFH